MKIPIIELFKLALDMLIWHLFFLFFQKSYLGPEGKVQKAHSKVATTSDPDNAAARGVKPLRQFHNCDDYLPITRCNIQRSATNKRIFETSLSH
jgi:hypothetical protein